MSDVICTVCARGGSKGIPRKNVREVGGKPLIGHAITDAIEWGRADDIVVSTDDSEIAEVAKEFGASVPFERPTALATDEAPKFPVIKHAVEQKERNRSERYDYVVDIDATAPLRQPQDIEDCYRAVTEDEQATNAYTVHEADKNPYFNMVELDDEGFAALSKRPEESICRRQDAPTVYAMNAAVYVYERDFLDTSNSCQGEFTRVSVMPPERSVDVDDEMDLRFVEFLLEHEEIK